MREKFVPGYINHVEIYMSRIYDHCIILTYFESTTYSSDALWSAEFHENVQPGRRFMVTVLAQCFISISLYIL